MKTINQVLAKRYYFPLRGTDVKGSYSLGELMAQEEVVSGADEDGEVLPRPFAKYCTDTKLTPAAAIIPC